MGGARTEPGIETLAAVGGAGLRSKPRERNSLERADWSTRRSLGREAYTPLELPAAGSQSHFFRLRSTPAGSPSAKTTAPWRQMEHACRLQLAELDSCVGLHGGRNG